MPNGNEEKMAEALEEERMPSRLKWMREMAKEKAKEAVKKAAKKAAEKAIKALGRMLIKALVVLFKFLVATAPYWGPVVLALLALFLIITVLISGQPDICPEINGIQNNVKFLYGEINGESNIYYPCGRYEEVQTTLQSGF